MERNYKSIKTTTRKEIKRVSLREILFYGFLILGASLIMVAPLLHKAVPDSNPVVDAYEKELDSKIEAIDLELSRLKDSYLNNGISAPDYIVQFDRLAEKKQIQEETNNDLYRQKVNEERIFGWKTLDVLFVGFGVRLPYLLFSFIISWLVFKINTKDRHLKKTFTYIQIVCYSSAFYQTIWCFWYSQDYPLKSYLFFAIALCIGLSVLFVNFITYRELFKMRLLKMLEENQLYLHSEKLQKALNAISHFAFIGIKKFIRPDKMDEYNKESIKTLKKGM